MSLKRILLAGSLIAATAGGAAASLIGVGAERAETPQGVSIRETSPRHHRGFFAAYYGSRSHRGGGLRGGK